VTGRGTLVRAAGREFELTCIAARVAFGIDESSRAVELVNEGVDWNAFLAGVERNCVVPVVYQNLRSINGSLIPTKVLDTLRVWSETIAVRNERMAVELVRLTNVFDSKGIQTINYKGAETAEEFYGSVALRSFNDLDFLVRRTDVGALVAVLESESYRNAEKFTSSQFDYYLCEFKEFMFRRDGILLEPHWSLAGRRYPFETDYEGFWRRSRMLRFRGVDVRVLAREDSLLVLCLAGAKGRWKRLQMVIDVAQCLRACPNLDWASIHAMAVTTGTVRILYLALLLAADLAGAPLPKELEQRVRDNSTVRTLAGHVVTSLAVGRSPRRFLPDNPGIFSPLLFRQRERIKDRWRYLWLTATSPQPLHMRRLPLPRFGFPLYRIFVPFHDFLMYPAVQLGKNLLVRRRRAASSL
jgi:hypothetical protein